MFLVLVGVAGYLATLYVPPYWTYLGLQDVVRVAADTAAARRDEAKARADIIQAAEEQSLVLTEDNINIFTRDTHLVIRVSWSVPIVLPKYRQTLRFTIEKSSPLP
ncbi:MAG: hypothetical protein HY712_02925 [candidate division NC10 bacterium]|nr:hypothetical protein [candidate division NC10 bacterium]